MQSSDFGESSDLDAHMELLELEITPNPDKKQRRDAAKCPTSALAHLPAAAAGGQPPMDNAASCCCWGGVDPPQVKELLLLQGVDPPRSKTTIAATFCG